MDEHEWGRLVAVEPLIRRVLRKRVDPSAVDDLVQETLERMSGRMGDLSADQLAAYAATCAVNAAASFHRTNARHRRLEPGLIDLSGQEGVDTQVVASEEASTLRLALEDMDASDRELLEAHHVDETSVAALARRSGRSEMAVRLSLSRARAKLRVNYTLAHQRVEPPTSRCRSVLLALSSGDRRAQQRLEADEHLERCPACSDLVAPATGQHRPAVGLLALLAWWWKGLSAAVRRSVSVGATVAGAAALAVVTVVTLSNTGRPAEQAATPTTATSITSAPVGAPTTTVASPPPISSGGIDTSAGPLLSTPSGLKASNGQQVTATSAVVTDVPANEGFWVQAADRGAIWVQLIDTGAESPVTITTGARVTFRGTVVAHDGNFAGLAGPPGERLRAQGQHLEVRSGDVQLG